VEFGHRGIRINSIAPGLTETPMTAHMAARLAQVRPMYPLRRLGTTQDIAAAAVWLASDECFMTGQNLQLNGGFSLTGVPVHPR
jgi:NAD(P)-dependent dehydrogenase (short-subunit alcohol dehydrogenase family)